MLKAMVERICRKEGLKPRMKKRTRLISAQTQAACSTANRTDSLSFDHVFIAQLLETCVSPKQRWRVNVKLTIYLKFVDCFSKNKLSRGETICPPPIAADLRPSADGSAVRTALAAWPGLGAARLAAQVGPTDRRTDGARRRLMPPRRRHIRTRPDHDCNHAFTTLWPT